MSTFWGKIFILALTIAGVIFAVKSFNKTDSTPAEPPRTYQDQIGDDDAKHRSAPKPTLQVRQAPGAKEKAAEEPEPIEIKFKKLTEAGDIQAERIFEMALVSFKQGRLPPLTFKKCVDYCRDIIEQYPGTQWEYKARRLLADVPKRHWKKYGITQEEVIIEN